MKCVPVPWPLCVLKSSFRSISNRTFIHKDDSPSYYFATIKSRRNHFERVRHSRCSRDQKLLLFLEHRFKVFIDIGELKIIGEVSKVRIIFDNRMTSLTFFRCSRLNGISSNPEEFAILVYASYLVTLEELGRRKDISTRNRRLC